MTGQNAPSPTVTSRMIAMTASTLPTMFLPDSSHRPRRDDQNPPPLLVTTDRLECRGQVAVAGIEHLPTGKRGDVGQRRLVAVAEQHHERRDRLPLRAETRVVRLELRRGNTAVVLAIGHQHYRHKGIGP